MAFVTRTPKDVPIHIRNLKFNRDAAKHPRWWHSNDPVPTAFFNAMSCTFPEGEKFFMDSVRAFKNVTPPEMKDQIRNFIGQEAVHSREHAAFNALAADAGYDVRKLEDGTRRSLALGRKRNKYQQLAVTCALEHFTALLGNALLEANSGDLDGAPEDAKRLWSWHAMEEIEHKAVCYDVFLAVTKDWSRARRYALRVFAMVMATVIFFHRVGANMASLYREDGINTPKTWLRTMAYFLWSPGALRRIALPYLGYYRPGFHPWDHDDRDLLAKTERQYGLAA
jgi:uncharacterized protein